MHSSDDRGAIGTGIAIQIEYALHPEPQHPWLLVLGPIGIYFLGSFIALGFWWSGLPIAVSLGIGIRYWRYRRRHGGHRLDWPSLVGAVGLAIAVSYLITSFTGCVAFAAVSATSSTSIDLGSSLLNGLNCSGAYFVSFLYLILPATTVALYRQKQKRIRRTAPVSL